MKGFVLVLLCALVAAQARHVNVVKSARSAAALGDNPWLVHLRIAVNTSGFLETCAGTLISEGWVLTAADCVRGLRFVWVRYGVVDVISPSLVTEGSIAIINEGAGIGLININRVVQFTDNISPATPVKSDAEVPSSGSVCAFGANEDGGPGETLYCNDVTLARDDDSIVASGDAATTKFDLGAGLVVDGKQYGVLTKAGDDDAAGTFTFIGDHLDWIEENTGVKFYPDGVEEADPESLLLRAN